MQTTAETNQEINRIIAENITAKDMAALEYVMKSPDGRWFIARLLANCHMNSLLGVAHADGKISIDESTMLVQEGERRVGIVLRNNILSLPKGIELLHTMENEQYSHRKQIDEIRRSSLGTQKG